MRLCAYPDVKTIASDFTERTVNDPANEGNYDSRSDEVDPLNSGCCGMAGSFGYEAEHSR